MKLLLTADRNEQMKVEKLRNEKVRLQLPSTTLVYVIRLVLNDDNESLSYCLICFGLMIYGTVEVLTQCTQVLHCLPICAQLHVTMFI